MKERPTLSQIARLARVHHSTVSRALHNDHRLPAKTKQRILKIAARIGYRPDPMLSALSQYRHSRAQNRYRATLGWMTNYPTRDGWNAYERADYFRGAKRRAAELGYLLEEFWLGEADMTELRAEQILLTKNIQGLLFIPQPRSRAHLSLGWSKFAAIMFGHTLARPIFHNVDNDHFRSFTLLMRQLKRRGYRRPGFVLWQRTNESTDRAWLGAFAAFQTLPPRKQIPVFTDATWRFTEFKKWMVKHRPDVVIAHKEIVLSWLKDMGLKVPRDVGFVLAAKHPEAPQSCSGVNENNERVGEVAIDVVVKMINSGERGVPPIPVSTLIEGTWVEGSTLRKSVASTS